MIYNKLMDTVQQQQEGGAAMDGYMLTYTLNTALIILVMLISLYLSGRSDVLNHTRRRSFVVCFTIVCLTAISEWLGVFLDGKNTPFLRGLHIFVKFVEFSLAPMLPVIMSISDSSKARAKVVLGFMSTNILLEFVSMFAGWVFYIDEAGFYRHSTVYVLYYLYVLVGIVYLMYEAYQLGRRNQYWRSCGLVCIVGLLVLGCVPHIVKSELRYDWLVGGMAVLLYYVYLIETTIIMDPVTHIFNRSSYDSALKKLKKDTIVVNFDVDNFKNINDKHGHLYGDEVLSGVADIIRETYGKYGRCYRVGGDEFGALITKSHPPMQEINSIFDTRIGERREKDERFPWVSHGYCIFDGDMDRLRETLSSADTMLYKYKEINKDKP